MALLKIFNANRPIPPGGSNTFLRLRAVPRPGHAWQMFAQNFGIVARGRFITQGSGMTSVVIRIAADEVGAPAGLEHVLVTITNTSVAGGTSYPMPIIDFFQNGTSTEPSTMSLMLGFGFPLDRLEVISARTGMWFQPGMNLLDPRYEDMLLYR